ncbi:SCP2 sterol-binding domain-containing protein [Patescibacteria group bacterium]|nr:SCP2 sterol-binding domain-containing protein [Patescibacteria group bacterium]MBU1916061.1 SCP2 sterol-binding domain-containing protein [Patescibacteria group bacterium]
MANQEILYSDLSAHLQKSRGLSVVEVIQSLMVDQLTRPLTDWRHCFQYRTHHLGGRDSHFDLKPPGQNYVLFITHHRPDAVHFVQGEPDCTVGSWPEDQHGELIFLVGLFAKRGTCIGARIILIHSSGGIIEIKDFGLPEGDLTNPQVQADFIREIRRLTQTSIAIA